MDGERTGGVLDGLGGERVVACAHLLQQCVVLGTGAGGALPHQVGGGRAGSIGQQGRGGGVVRTGHGQLGGVGKGVQHPGQVRPHLPVDQGDQTGAVSQGLLVRGREDGQVDAADGAVLVATGHQCGVAGDLQPAHGGLVDARHPVLGEAAQVGAGQVVTAGGDRGLHALLEAGLEIGQGVAAADLAALGVHHPEVHAQVGGQLRQVELGPVQGEVLGHPGQGHQLIGHGLHEGLARIGVVVVEGCGHGLGPLGGRHQVAADRLGQGADQLGDQLVAHAGHQPVEAARLETVQHGQRHGGGHAIGPLGPHLAERVAQRQGDVALHPGVRVVPCQVGDVGVRVQQVVLGEGEQVRRLVPLLLPPGVEVGAGDHLGGDPLVVEAEQLLVGDQQVAPTGLGLQLLESGDQGTVVSEEVVAGAPVPLDQGVLDEDVASGLGVDASVAHHAVGHDGNPVQGDLLVGHRAGLLGGPVRCRM